VATTKAATLARLRGDGAASRTRFAVRVSGTLAPGAPMSSLIPFHRFLITCGIAFCLGFAAWEAVAYFRGGDALALVLAVTFGVLGAGLAFYLRHLRRFLKLPAGK
jgi:hypothetical protein